MTPSFTYAELAKAGMSDREIEASALIKAAARMTSALENGGSLALADALSHNQKLWSIIAAAVSDEKSPLPESLRGNILALASFVLRQTSMSSTEKARLVLPQLIAINRDIAAGLRAAA